MLRLPSYITLRENTYHFRYVLPADVREHFGRREVKRSLKTSDRRIAVQLAKTLSFDVWKQISKVREMSNPYLNEMIMKGITIPFGDFGNITIDHIETDDSKPIKEELAALETVLKNIPTPNNNINSNKKLPKQIYKLSDLIKAYEDERQSARRWKQKTYDENHAIYNLLLEVAGDVLTAGFSYELANEVKQTISKLPPNKNKKFPGIPIEDVLAMGLKQCEIRTLNKYLNRYATLFDYGVKHGYVEANYFQGMQVKLRKNVKDAVDPFDSDELQKIFSTDVFTKNKRAKDYYYWLPLLGLYTGARINEICQLYVDDIGKDGGIFFIDINENTSDKQLKNDSSKRRVPLHNKLIKLGFIDYVVGLKNRGINRIFPELTHQRDGYGTVASKWFARYRKKLGIEGRNKVFHSLRHNVATALKQNNIDYMKAGAILGHYNNSITFNTYASGYTMEQLSEVIETLDFSESLKNVKPF